MTSSDQVVLHLAEILSNFQDREYGGVIDRSTMFFADLGMSSIDAVILGETLQNKYTRELPFAEFLAELGRNGAQDLSVGELADWLAGCLG
jgi:acyl carrier protein